MADKKPAKKDEKAAKARRKHERESVLSPTFTAARESAAVSAASREQETDGNLLQRLSQNPAGPIPDERLTSQPVENLHPAVQTGGQDFSKVPVHSQGQWSAKKAAPPDFGWGNTYHPARKTGSSWGILPGSRLDLLQRVATDFGDFNDTTYNTLTTPAGKKVGVEIVLEFVPNAKVDADLFGLTQALKPTNKGKPNPVDITAKKRMVKEGVGAGWYIDQAKYNRNPLYPVEKAKSTAAELWEGPTPSPVAALTPKQIKQFAAASGVKGQTHKGWGGHGWRHKVGGVWDVKNAELHDTPMRPNRGKNAGQVFETTALAIKGAQKGTYYGSVEWGWKTDNAGVFEKLPLRLVSSGVPSEEFMAAAGKWNTAKTSANKSTIPLPIVKELKMFSNSLDPLLEMGPYVGIPKGTHYKFLEEPDIMVAKIEVTDGPYKGQQGYINTLDNPKENL